MITSNKWRTKYQMEGLKDNEWYNLRDKKIYIVKKGKWRGGKLGELTFTLKEKEKKQ